MSVFARKPTGPREVSRPARLPFVSTVVLAAVCYACWAPQPEAGELLGVGWRLGEIPTPHRGIPASRDHQARGNARHVIMIGDNAPEEAAQQDAAPLAATVLGEAIHTSDPNELQEAILSRLFDRYAAEHGIVVEPAEIDAYVAAVRSGEAAEGGAVEQDETGAADELLRGMADAVIRRWKINKALYERNGGRIIYQQLGPEPLDAYREFLEDSERQGAFKIVEAPMAAGFWRYFRDESMHDFMAPGGPDEAQAFVVPPWERGQ